MMADKKLPPKLPDTEIGTDDGGEEYNQYEPLDKHVGFPDKQPPLCGRDCEKIYENSTENIHFAMYASRTNQPDTVCFYARSVGCSLSSKRFTLRKGETPGDLLKRALPIILAEFTQFAVVQRDALKCTEH